VHAHRFGTDVDKLCRVSVRSALPVSTSISLIPPERQSAHVSCRWRSSRRPSRNSDKLSTSVRKACAVHGDAPEPHLLADRARISSIRAVLPASRRPATEAARRASRQRTLLTEEVMGFEGFSGLESILYHLQSPCRVIECGRSSRSFARSGSRRLTRTATCARGTSRPEETRCPAGNFYVEQRVEIALCRPTKTWTTSSATARARGDLRPRGLGTLETIFGDLRTRRATTVVVPRARRIASALRGAAVSGFETPPDHDSEALPQRATGS